MLLAPVSSCHRRRNAAPTGDAAVAEAIVPRAQPAPEFDEHPSIEAVPAPALEASLLKKCPTTSGATTDEIKLAMGKQLDCLEEYLASSWKRAVAAARRADPKRAEQLTELSQKWTGLARAACFVEEQRSWVDFHTGLRTDGSAYGAMEMRCRLTAAQEQIYLATAMQRANPHPVAARIESLAPQGETLRRLIEYIARRCAHFLRTPPERDAGAAEQGLRPFEEWDQTEEAALAVLRQTRPVANSMCTNWPGLARLLGGAPDCERKTALYMYRMWIVSS